MFCEERNFNTRGRRRFRGKKAFEIEYTPINIVI
jgi:hypothetical protein